MRRLLLLLAATAFTASPVLAQHTGHTMPGMTMPKPAKKAPAKKKPAAKKPAAKKPAAKKAATKKPGAKKAAAKKPATKKKAAAKAPEPAPAADPHAGHQMPEGQPAADPHAGHAMPAPEATTDPHAGHDMGAAAVDVPVGPPPPEALQGPENAADRVWGSAAMEPGRSVLFGEHGNIATHKILVDQLEWRAKAGRDGYFLKAEAWFGGDIDKLWLKTEIEGERGRKPEQAELQALWSHAIDPWFNLQAGVRLDAEPQRGARLVVGIEGLAPYWIEIDAAAFLSDKGDVTARFEAEHDMRITQKLILQPRAELDFAFQDIPSEGIGAGLSTVDLGARLRYEFVPNFGPYLGITYERAIGDSARFRRAEGEDVGGFQFVAGVRAWF